MTSTFDMQDLRYLNLFAQITKVNTRYFFEYNNMLVFCVPRRLIKQALGQNAENLKKMSGIIGKRIRVVAQPNGVEDAREFIERVVSPLTFNDLEITVNEIIMNAGRMNKALLIGREKRRLIEMQNIIKYFFKREFRIV
ncbi:MAG TPA: hypothetical protein VJA20_03415 [Candidatus Nanoarchaeia archaeon]|nr:hypothetical protein [Candidatus Nanoarchaeia archaeon]